MKNAFRTAAIALAAVAAVSCSSSPEISLDGNRFRARGAEGGTLTVTVAGSDVPLFGELRREGGVITFEPRYPLKAGLEYRAVLEGSPGSERRFRIPAAPAGDPTSVVSVFPSGDTLPENLLKFYLHFSAPMSRREAYRHLHLKDGSGKDVDLPFLELGEELWDPSATRITLLFDPGRIKRGLKPREDSGPALEEGKSYTLVIDPDWPDANGRPLVKGFSKAFKVGAPDEHQPDPKAWTLTAPKAGGSDPLVVTLDEPLDEAMLNRSLVVVDTDGRTVRGRIEIDRGETRWRFLPESPWKAAKHALVVDTVLEDRAGNSIDRPFEVDVVRPLDRKLTGHTVELPFEPVR